MRVGHGRGLDLVVDMLVDMLLDILVVVLVGGCSVLKEAAASC